MLGEQGIQLDKESSHSKRILRPQWPESILQFEKSHCGSTFYRRVRMVSHEPSSKNGRRMNIGQLEELPCLSRSWKESLGMRCEKRGLTVWAKTNAMDTMLMPRRRKQEIRAACVLNTRASRKTVPMWILSFFAFPCFSSSVNMPPTQAQKILACPKDLEGKRFTGSSAKLGKTKGKTMKAQEHQAVDSLRAETPFPLHSQVSPRTFKPPPNLPAPKFLPPATSRASRPPHPPVSGPSGVSGPFRLQKGPGQGLVRGVCDEAQDGQPVQQLRDLGRSPQAPSRNSRARVEIGGAGKKSARRRSRAGTSHAPKQLAFFQLESSTHPQAPEAKFTASVL